MDNPIITISGKGVEGISDLNIEIAVEAVIDADPKLARKAATKWLVSEVGNMLIAGNPRLVISQNTVWRHPVLLTSTEQGIVGEVGVVDVDATTGKPLVSDALRDAILDNVQSLISPALSAVS